MASAVSPTLLKEKFTKGYSLLSLDRLIKQKKLWMNPYYQRESVWTKSQKQSFIDSLLIDIDIPKLYLHRTVEPGYDYEVVDGQQRLRAIDEFIRGKFELPDYSRDVDGYQVAGLKYAKLPRDVKDKLQTVQLDVVFLNAAYTQEDIEEMFTRYQNGTPLNAAEKRRSYPGNMKHVVTKLAKHHVFSFCGFSETRYAYEDAVAKALHLLINGRITDIRPDSIKTTYDQNQKIDEKDTRVKNLQKTFDFLDQAFKGLDPKLKKWAIITLSFLVSGLLVSYNLTEYPSEFGRTFVDFETKRKDNTNLEEKDQDRDLLAFTNTVRSDSIPDMEYRDRILRLQTFMKLQDLEPLDPTRGFTEDQRLALYAREGGKCQSCGRLVDQNEFHVEYIKDPSAGGKIRLSNARLIGPECAKKEGKPATKR